MQRRFTTILLCSVLLAGCAGWPRPVPERSPLVRPVGVRVFIPAALQRENKLGCGGCSAAQLAQLGGSWTYAWSTHPDAGAPEAVPMIWDETHIGEPLGGRSKWLLGFNEPDLAGQAALTPEEAAKLWRVIEERYPDRLLVAPVPSQKHLDWLPQFRGAYRALYGTNPRLDALAFHCYLGTAGECIWLGGQFVRWAEEWAPAGRPLEVWCTEFAFLLANRADAEAQAQGFVRWLEAERVITRYAPYVSYNGDECPSPWWGDCRPGADPSLFTRTGELTDVGRWYVKPTPAPWD